MSGENNLIEQVKKYLQIKKEENLKAKKLRRFGYALESLDAEKINDFLDDGISIQDFEKNESVLATLLKGYDHYLFNIIDDYRRKVLKMKDSEFFHEFLKMNQDDMPEDLKKLIVPLNETILNLLEALYLRGADINHHTYLGYSENFLSDKREIKEGPSVMQYIINCLIYSKQMSLVDWILSKEELVLEGKMVNQALNGDNHDSVLLLDRLLDRGFEWEVFDFYGLKVTPLSECLALTDIAYRQEKFNVLWEHATELEKQETKEQWKMDNIVIPEENVGYGSGEGPKL